MSRIAALAVHRFRVLLATIKTRAERLGHQPPGADCGGGVEQIEIGRAARVALSGWAMARRSCSCTACSATAGRGGELDELCDEFTLVAWDAPGCGRSSDPPAGFRLPSTPTVSPRSLTGSRSRDRTWWAWGSGQMSRWSSTAGIRRFRRAWCSHGISWLGRLAAGKRRRAAAAVVPAETERLSLSEGLGARGPWACAWRQRRRMSTTSS